MEFNKKYGNGKRFEREKMTIERENQVVMVKANSRLPVSKVLRTHNHKHPSDTPLQLDLWAYIHIALLTIGMGQAHPAHY
jgi:hypothetical protein